MKTPVFKYLDGSAVKVGDSVLLENGRTPGIVEFVAITQEEMQSINVEEPGIMFKSPPFGCVYLPQWSLEQDPIRLVSRASEA